LIRRDGGRETFSVRRWGVPATFVTRQFAWRGALVVPASKQTRLCENLLRIVSSGCSRVSWTRLLQVKCGVLNQEWCSRAIQTRYAISGIVDVLAGCSRVHEGATLGFEPTSSAPGVFPRHMDTTLEGECQARCAIWVIPRPQGRDERNKPRALVCEGAPASN